MLELDLGNWSGEKISRECKNPPVNIDAAVRLVATMHWPKNPQKHEEYLALMSKIIPDDKPMNYAGTPLDRILKQIVRSDRVSVKLQRPYNRVSQGECVWPI